MKAYADGLLDFSQQTVARALEQLVTDRRREFPASLGQIRHVAAELVMGERQQGPVLRAEEAWAVVLVGRSAGTVTSWPQRACRS